LFSDHDILNASATSTQADAGHLRSADEVLAELDSLARS
jgi:hypothetical protein